MSLFRTILILVSLGFGAASFFFGIQVKAKYWEREGYLWESRRENHRLRSSMEEAGDRNAALERTVAALTLELDGRDRRIAALESRLSDAELDLAILTIDRDDLIRENVRLAAHARSLEGDVEALAAQIYRSQMESDAKDWLANLKEAGRLVASAVPGRNVQPRAESASVAPADVVPDPAPLVVREPDGAVAAEWVEAIGRSAFDADALDRWRHGLSRVVERVRGLGRELEPWILGAAFVLRETANLRCAFPMAFRF